MVIFLLAYYTIFLLADEEQMVHSNISGSVVSKRKRHHMVVTEADCDAVNMGYIPKFVQNL